MRDPGWLVAAVACAAVTLAACATEPVPGTKLTGGRPVVVSSPVFVDGPRLSGRTPNGIAWSGPTWLPVDACVASIESHARVWGAGEPPMLAYEVQVMPGAWFSPAHGMNLLGSCDRSNLVIRVAFDTDGPDPLPVLRHEYHHAWLWATRGDADGAHLDPSWDEPGGYR